MYDISDKYLYEILEDFQAAGISSISCPGSAASGSTMLQKEIFHAFCNGLWNQTKPYELVQKSIRFTIPQRLLETELGRLFEKWSSLTYTAYHSVTKDINYLALIRQKINNIYLTMFHEEVILQKEYLELLKVPKSLYFSWKNGEDFTPSYVSDTIGKAMKEADQLKMSLTRRKIKISFEEYRLLIEEYLLRCFCNYKPMDQEAGWDRLSTTNSLWNEDAYGVRYICRSINGYLKNYQKKYFHLYNPGSKDNIVFSYCMDCSALFRKKANNQIRCRDCQIKKNKEDSKMRVRKYRSHVTKL